MHEGKWKFAAYVLFQLSEVAVFVVAFAAGMIALDQAGIITLADYAHPFFFGVLAVFAVLWNRLLNAFDLYLSRRLISRSNEYLSLVFAVAIASAFLSLAGALLGQPINSSVFLSWFMLVAVALLVPGRILGRLLLRTARAYGRNLRFVAIVGAGAEAQALARHIQANPQFGFQIRGLFDTAAMRATLPKDLNGGGSLRDLSQILMHEPVDEVLIALPMASRFDDIRRALNMCARTGVSARVTGELLLNIGYAAPEIEMIGNNPSLHYDAVPNWGWQGKVKRGLDVVGAGLGLIALLPLFLVVAILIKLDSPGPVFFVQTRVGKNRKHFNFLKFRTMIQDAEARQADLESRNEAGGPVFKIKSDPRITRLGHFLRKYSIDELPQLINVLIGEMSLVGPRPLPLRDVARFEHDWYSRRFSVRPGLTCSWVLAGRSQLDFDVWVQTDLDYIDNWSLLKDFKICLLTVPAVARGSGAY
jgi:exopolysaccharide biosynthesis polyprenyl glycosylphosphotransferase